MTKLPDLQRVETWRRRKTRERCSPKKEVSLMWGGSHPPPFWCFIMFYLYVFVCSFGGPIVLGGFLVTSLCGFSGFVRCEWCQGGLAAGTATWLVVLLNKTPLGWLVSLLLGYDPSKIHKILQLWHNYNQPLCPMMSKSVSPWNPCRSSLLAWFFRGRGSCPCTQDLSPLGLGPNATALFQRSEKIN